MKRRRPNCRHSDRVFFAISWKIQENVHPISSLTVSRWVVSVCFIVSWIIDSGVRPNSSELPAQDTAHRSRTPVTGQLYSSGKPAGAGPCHTSILQANRGPFSSHVVRRLFDMWACAAALEVCADNISKRWLIMDCSLPRKPIRTDSRLPCVCGLNLTLFHVQPASGQSAQPFENCIVHPSRPRWAAW